MTKQTLNMRFIATGGVLKGVLKPEEEVTQEEMLTPSGQDEAQDEPKRIGFRYMPHYGKYVYSLAHTNFELVVSTPKFALIENVVRSGDQSSVSNKRLFVCCVSV